ncbi:MAG: NAD(P)-binding domain-containing protein [Kofleriaceae bacterium]
MKIAIIGSGNIGGGLAAAWAARHQITFGARDPEDAELVAQCRTLGARAATVAAAVRDAEVIVLAMPWKALDDVVSAAGDLAGKIVIDCTNAVGPGMQLRYGHTTSASEELARRLPGAHVVKSFNAQGAENLANPIYGGVRACNFFCGDSAEAKQAVRALIEEVGFEPVDVGGLVEARLLEPLMVLWIRSSLALGTRDLAFKILRR